MNTLFHMNHVSPVAFAQEQRQRKNFFLLYISIMIQSV
jgi:hypothetical protein